MVGFIPEGVVACAALSVTAGHQPCQIGGKIIQHCAVRQIADGKDTLVDLFRSSRQIRQAALQQGSLEGMGGTPQGRQIFFGKGCTCLSQIDGYTGADRAQARPARR